MKVAVLGGGSWGTALAMHLARKNYEIRIWEFFDEQAVEMQEKRFCRLLPEVKLPENIFVSNKMEEVLPGTELVLLVVPSDKVKVTMKAAKGLLENQPIVICSKGLADDTRLLTEMIREMVENELFCLYGPTHAEEVCKGLFSGIVLAGKNHLKKWQEVLASENLRVEITDDLVGVQVAAALKNILAVFVGVLDGMGLGDNAAAYVMTKGLAEIREVGLKMGGKEETFTGLAGLGDLIVTCTSKHSRNRHAGQEVGKGKKLDEVIKSMAMVAEGVTTAKTAIGLKDKLGLELPLITGLYEILFAGKDSREILKGI